MKIVKELTGKCRNKRGRKQCYDSYRRRFSFISERPRLSANISMSVAVLAVTVFIKWDSQTVESASISYLQATHSRSPAILSST